MEIISNASAMQEWSRRQRQAGDRIGLVPTMGFLHAGHLSLVQMAKSDCQRVVVSIFVNPIQFAAHEDLSTYPRDFERDVASLAAAGVDVVFNPTAEVMYPDGFSSAVMVEGELTQTLCGRSRPTHFRGVTTVVSKLFNLCLPDRAYFGQKDAQQATIIERMVRDLNFPVEIIRGPIVREADGLAMSSRNSYLNAEERRQAPVLYQALTAAAEQITAGERDPIRVAEFLRNRIHSSELAQPDYIEICDAENLRAIGIIDRPVLMAVAVKFGQTRLIDNLLVEV